ncbi:MAG: hypothetical protein WBO88_12765, partial [Candidatus Dechloromonas phosphoritropha]
MANVEAAAISAWYHAGSFTDGDRLCWRRATPIRAGPTAIVPPLPLLRSRRRLPELPLLAGSASVRGRLLALCGSWWLPRLARLAGHAGLLRLTLLRSRRGLPELP